MQRDEDGLSTRAIHAGKELNPTNAVTPPIWQTSTYRAESPAALAETASAFAPAEFYARYGNPTERQLEAVLASLEGGERALVTASGMGAIFTTLMALLGAGDHVVAQDRLYDGSTKIFRDVLPRFGITTTIVDPADASGFERALRPTTKLLFAETPTNPLCRVTDLRAIAALGKARGVTTIVDNTFATPALQRPLELGIDLAIHSATKYLGGHSDVLAGAVVGARAPIERIHRFSVIAGAALGPFDAWLVLRGVRTLPLRMERHAANALALARFLERHPAVARVHYPGLESHPDHALARAQMKAFGGMLSLELRSYDEAARFVTSLRLATHAPSLGGFETLVVHPAGMWNLPPEARAATGVGDALVRVSVGLEDADDLLRDFDHALVRP